MYDLPAAAIVFWGEYVDINSVILMDEATPEKILIQNESLKRLSKEAKELIDLISELPEEMFFSNGKLKINEVKILLREKKWQWQLIPIVMNEIKQFLSE